MTPATLTPRIPQLPLVLPILFIVHCLEELPTFISFADRHGLILPPSNPRQLAAAMVAFLLVIAWVSLRASQARAPGDRRMVVWFVMFAAMMIHAMVNVTGGLALQEYAPGAYVAGLLYLPYGAYTLVRSLREGWLSLPGLAAVAALGLLLYTVLAAALLVIGPLVRAS